MVSNHRGNSRNSRTPHWRGDAPCLPANGRLNIWPGILDNSSERADWDGISTLLVAGFNPVEKIFVKMGSSSPIFGVKIKHTVFAKHHLDSLTLINSFIRDIRGVLDLPPPTQ